MNENISHNFFIWEEKNSTEPQKNCENKNASETKDTTNDTQTNVENLHWKDITDPKLRTQMRKRDYNKVNRDKIKAKYEANKIEINAKKKAYRDANKDKIKSQRKVSYEKNKEKIKLYYKSWYKSNIAERKLYIKSYYVINKDKRRTYEKKWNEINKDKIKKNYKKYREKNKERIRNHHKNYCNRRFKTDIQFKLQSNLRSRLNTTIKKNFKSGSAVRDLGCTIEELKSYLESKFLPGMTWDNWSRDGWHIDHIKPLSSFDLSDRKQLLEACHYTNLQPLWAKDNLTKSDKII